MSSQPVAQSANRHWSAPPVNGLEDCTPYAYSNTVQAGPFIYLAGQCGLGDDHEVVSLDFETQARRVLERIRIALEAAGASLNDIVSMTVFVRDVRQARTFTGMRKEYFSEPYPASAVVEASKFIPAGALIEVQAVAYNPTLSTQQETAND